MRVIRTLISIIFSSDLKKEIKKRKQEEKMKIKDAKPVWKKRKAMCKVLQKNLAHRTRGFLKITLEDSKFDKTKVINDNGFTKIKVAAKFGTLYIVPYYDKIKVFSTMKGFKCAGSTMSIDTFIKNISQHF